MFHIPKFNIYSTFSRFQDKIHRRLRLLKFVGPQMWGHDDFALVGAYGPVPANVMMSVSTFPQGTVSAADGGAGGTLTLNTLSASDFDVSVAQAGVRFLRNGDVQELSNGAWASQNPTVEWIDINDDATIGDDYQARLTKVSGFNLVFSSGWSNNTFLAISTTRSATLTSASGERTNTSTATVRETANTSNSVSATAFISAEALGGGVFL